jgi:hypothetical protein
VKRLGTRKVEDEKVNVYGSVLPKVSRTSKEPEECLLPRHGMKILNGRKRDAGHRGAKDRRPGRI